MKQGKVTLVQGSVVEEQLQLSLLELCQACCIGEDHVKVWVLEGVLQPVGESPEHWRFGGESLRRARLALSLSRDLELNPPGVALALDLLDEIAELRARLQRIGAT